MSGAEASPHRQEGIAAFCAQEQSIQRASQESSACCDDSALQRQPADVRRERNAHRAPVYRVPNELLVESFRLALSESSARWERDMRTWNNLNLVCYHWREVLCSTPLFWSDVRVGRSLDWIRLCLLRSQKYPLCLSVYGLATDASVRALQGATSRVRSLGLTVGLTVGTSTAASLLDSIAEAPALEELILRRETSFRAPSSKPFPSSAHNLVQRLRLLDIEKYEAPRQILHCRQLRSLKLTDTSFPHTTMEQLLTALASNALLEELSIVESDAKDAHHTLTVTPSTMLAREKLSFRRLLRLELKSSFQPLVHHVLHRCRFPKAEDVTIVTNVEGSVSKLGPELMHDDSPFVDPFPAIASRVTVLNLSVGGVWSKDNTAWATTLPRGTHGLRQPQVNGHSSSSPPAVSLYISPFVVHQIARQFSAAPITHVDITVKRHSLDWDHSVDYFQANAGTWTSIFRAFPLLESFSFAGSYSSARTMWEGLLLASQTEPESTGELHCDRLRQLEVVDSPDELEYSALYNLAMYKREATPRRLWQAMLDALTYRAQRGRRLEALRLVQPGMEVHAASFSALTGLVDSLVCDFLARRLHL
ncbi:hypothetical protein FKP32DRAFT_1595068 [Trametes sanguinea]|nr:hypothetical protein FKP32DRAFT_1595068 [Trametes sanguinea]